MSVYGGRVQLSDGRWKDGMCAKEGNQGMFFFFKLIIIIFLFSRERWNHAGCLLQDDTGHYREETRVLFCLDVSFIFFMKLVAVIAW